MKKLKSVLNHTEGKAPIWTPIYFILAISSIYLVLQYFPPYYESFKVSRAFKTVSEEAGHKSERDFNDILHHRLRRIDPPFDFEEIAITKVGDTLILDMVYTRKVKLPFREPHVLQLNPHSEVKVRPRS